jgi:hypothetical protein
MTCITGSTEEKVPRGKLFVCPTGFFRVGYSVIQSLKAKLSKQKLTKSEALLKSHFEGFKTERNKMALEIDRLKSALTSEEAKTKNANSLTKGPTNWIRKVKQIFSIRLDKTFILER